LRRVWPELAAGQLLAVMMDETKHPGGERQDLPAGLRTIVLRFTDLTTIKEMEFDCLNRFLRSLRSVEMTP